MAKETNKNQNSSNEVLSGANQGDTRGPQEVQQTDTLQLPLEPVNQPVKPEDQSQAPTQVSGEAYAQQKVSAIESQPLESELKDAPKTQALKDSEQLASEQKKENKAFDERREAQVNDNINTSGFEEQQSLLEKYGANYVQAERNGIKTTFSRKSWDMMSAHKDGWKETVKTPQEVKNLQK